MSKLKKNLIIAAFCIGIIGSVLSMSAYIGDFEHKVYVYEIDGVTISINESYTMGIIHYGESLDYNCTISNSGVSSCYVFVEFDSPMANNNKAIFVPSAGDGWELYDEDTVHLTNKTSDQEMQYHRYLFSYSSDATMTELEPGLSTENVFRTIEMTEMEESTYESIGNKEFNVVARAVMVESDNSAVDTAWDQVPKGYNQ